MNPKELVKMVKDKGIKIIDFRFVDMPGLWQHFSMASNRVGRIDVRRRCRL